MRLGQWIKLNLVPPLGARLIQGLGRTLHITKVGEDQVQELYQKGQSIIFAFLAWSSINDAVSLSRETCVYLN